MPDERGSGRRAGAPPRWRTANGLPRWIYISIVIATILVLLAVILAATGVLSADGDGGHGPRRHGLPAGTQGDPASLAGQG